MRGIDHETLAERTGLSVHQVRRGMGAPSAAGLATTRRRARDGRMVNHIRLSAPALAARVGTSA